MSRLICCGMFLLAIFGSGCAEGTKANPLRRASAVAQAPVETPKPEPPKLEFGDPIPVPPSPVPAPEKTLFDRLGKATVLKKVVDDYVDALMDTEMPGADIRKRFPESGPLRKLLLAFFSDLSGGPPLGAGKSPEQVYAEVGFFESHHDLAISQLRKSCAVQNISAADSDALVTQLEKLRKKSD